MTDENTAPMIESATALEPIEHTTQPEQSPILALEEKERQARLAELRSQEDRAAKEADERARKRAEIEAQAHAPTNIHAIAADARDATLAYLDDHKDMSAAAQSYRAMLLAIAKFCDSVAAMK